MLNVAITESSRAYAIALAYEYAVEAVMKEFQDADGDDAAEVAATYANDNWRFWLNGAPV